MSRSRGLRGEIPLLVLVALALALVIKAFFVQAFFIPSESMEKTLHGCHGCNGDRVLVNKLVYDFRGIHRGEIVVFRGPPSWGAEVPTSPASHNPVRRFLRGIGRAVGAAPPSEKDFIKRVIGVPGDTVQCCDAKGRVVVNGVALDEPYLFEDDHAVFGPITVPKGRLWVMGDHRGASGDSRSHQDDHQGTIPERNVIGRAFVKVWPPHRFGMLPVPRTFLADGVPLESGVLAASGLFVVRRRRRPAAVR
ncbi:MAG: signal peptidase [Frankiales bacterium]|jgi:signal peptidase I|nr:signal peptidase [Frankiales bacterium]